MKRTFAIANRIIKQLLRDKRTLALVFIAPVFVMFLLNVMFSANTSVSSTIATYNVSSKLNKQLDKVKHVTVKKYSSKANAKKALKQQKVDATIIKKKNNHYSITYANTDSSKTTLTKQAFQAALTTTNIKKMQTATQKMQATLAKLSKVPALKGVIPNVKLSTQSQKSAKVKITNHYQYGNKDTGFFTKMIPILLGFFVFFFVFLISGMALLGERTSGTLDRLLATPVKRSEIVYGYMISYGILAILQTIVVVLATIWMLNIQVVGNVFDIIVINVLLALVALAFGILLSTFAASEFQMMQFIPLVVLPQVFFSGIIPLDSMASWVQAIGKILPLTYAGDALNQIIFNGTSLVNLGGDILALLIFLVVLTFINILGLKRYRKV